MYKKSSEEKFIRKKDVLIIEMLKLKMCQKIYFGI